MKRMYAVAVLVMLVLSMVAAAYAYVKPYKLGTGKYLSVSEKTALQKDISDNASEEFKLKYFSEMGRLAADAGIFKESITINIIEFKGSPSFLENVELPSDATVYLQLLDFKEIIPDRDAAKAERASQEFYDIWTFSGLFIQFYKSKDSGYTFIKSGAAE